MNLNLFKLMALLCLLVSSPCLLAQHVVSGTILDANTKEPLVGANIIIHGSIDGAASAIDGKYNLTTDHDLPFTLTFSYLGYNQKKVEVKENNSIINISLEPGSILGQEIVVSASRMKENIMQSPVTVEKMNTLAIKQAPTADYYDALANIKGVQVTNSSLNFTSVNMRGFADASNPRIVQLVDGMDVSEASINYPIGSYLAPSELDAESVELLPGAASALYGPNAFNGIMLMKSKSPFQYQGLSVLVKQGITSSNAGGTDPLGSYGFRYAKAYNDKIAFKINVSYMGGTDWTANDFKTDRLRPDSPTDLSNNQDFDGVNLYGDEGAFPIDTYDIRSLSRTGIPEDVLLDTKKASTFKANAAIHYRLNEETELTGSYAHGRINAIAQSNSKYAYRDGNQHFAKLELAGDNYFIRTYGNFGLAENSYNIDALGAFVNEYFHPSANPDGSGWYNDYITAMAGGIPEIAESDSTAARAYADRFMIDPTTGQYVPSFQDTINKVLSNYFQGDPPGATFYDKTRVWYSEAYYNLKKINWMEVSVGGSYTNYNLVSKGTLFDEAPDDPNNLQPITTNAYGGYIQLGKTFIEKIKLGASLRYDKMKDFEGHITPRFSIVYSPDQNHNFRASYQTGFRFPTMLEQFIYFPIPGGIALGSVQSTGSRYGVYEGGAWTADSYSEFLEGDGKVNATTGAIEANPGNVTLVEADVPYLKPEQLWSYEVGYKGIIAKKLLIDFNYYYTSYSNFIGSQFVVNKFATSHQGEQINAGTTWALYANSPYTLTSNGIGIGLSYTLPKNLLLNGHYTYSSYSGQQDPNFIAGFNTPTNRFGIGIGSSEITRNFGFNINYRYQESFLWESLYGTDEMPAYGILNAQINYKIPSMKTIIKLGGSNLGGGDYRTSFGSPFVGQVYYISLVFDELIN
jgi:iron complex outermembrane receptor protein